MATILILAPLVLAVFLLVVLKLFEPLLNRLGQALFRRMPTSIPAHPGKGRRRRASFIFKVYIEAYVGLIIFMLVHRVFSIPVLFVLGGQWVPPVAVQVILVILPVALGFMAVYSALRFIHRHLSFTD